MQGFRSVLLLAAPLCASVGLPQVSLAEESTTGIEEVVVTARYPRGDRPGIANIGDGVQ